VYAERSGGHKGPRSGQLRPAGRHRPWPSGRPAPSGPPPRKDSHRSTLGVAGSIMAGQGVVWISARDKGRCIVVECSLPLLHRLLQFRSLRDFACQFCAERAFNKLSSWRRIRPWSGPLSMNRPSSSALSASGRNRAVAGATKHDEGGAMDGPSGVHARRSDQLRVRQGRGHGRRGSARKSC
jgi:hypothetical protein